MIQMILINFIQALIGFSGGIVVGAGFVAFISVLKIIPRLTQLTKTEKLIKTYTAGIIIGLFLGTVLSFSSLNWQFPVFILLLWGFAHGIFNGMLAAALTEVLKVFPILSKRVRLDRILLWLLMAIMFGKIIGSLFQWTIFVTI